MSDRTVADLLKYGIVETGDSISAYSSLRLEWNQDEGNPDAGYLRVVAHVRGGGSSEVTCFIHPGDGHCVDDPCRYCGCAFYEEEMF